jgi:hypothetical protein
MLMLMLTSATDIFNRAVITNSPTATFHPSSFFFPASQAEVAEEMARQEYVSAS